MREEIKKYVDSLNLNDYDLGGVEITDEDIDNIVEKVLHGVNIESATDEMLYDIRNTLDEGLDDILE